jgi:plastocyanin
VSESEAVVSGAAEPQAGGASWVKLLKWASIVNIVDIALVNVFAGIIPPLVIFALIFLGGVIWLGRATKGPAILLLVAMVAHLGTSAPFVIPTLAVPASAGDFILNIAAILADLAGIVAAIAVIRGKLGTSGAARQIGMGASGLFIVGVVVSVFATINYDDAVAQEGDLQLVTQDIEFNPTSLEGGAGEISVFVDNKDGTLHTFTIEELDVNLNIPASSSARITFDAEPGTYEFICTPHKEDMEGTLTVE